MIITKNAPIQPVLRTQNVVQPAVNRETKQEALEQNSNISYVGADPFVQQMRSASEANLIGRHYEAFRSESNRVRTGLEARTEGILEEIEYNQLFEREQNTREVENSPRRDLELPPMEAPVFGRDEDPIEPIQIRDANEEKFIPYVEYAPLSTPEVELGFYRYETELGKQNSRDRMLMREPLEPLPAPPFRPAFSQPKDEDFSYLPPPKHETLNAPLPSPLQFRETQTDFLNQTTNRIETDGAQPVQESAQQTIRTFDDRTKPPRVLPQSGAQEQADAVLPTPPPFTTPVEVKEIAPPASPGIANVNREAPVVETTPPSEPVDSYQQLEGLLSGTTQLAEEDRYVINKSER